MKKLTPTKLRLLIEQEVEHDLAADHPMDVVASEDAYAGGDNLVLNVPHIVAVGNINKNEIPLSPETLSITDDSGVMTVSETKLRKMIRNIIKSQK